MSAGASRLPLVMLVHLAANLDNWDPRTVDQLAKSRHLILVDLPGVGGSGGTVPPTLEEAGQQAARIVRGLGVSSGPGRHPDSRIQACFIERKIYDFYLRMIDRKSHA